MHEPPKPARAALLLHAVLLAFCGAAAAENKPQDEGPRFDIMAFNVAGNTVLTVEQIEAAVYPFLGPDKQLKDVEAARAALEKAYQDRGYLSVVVDIPQQKASSGEIRLEVTQATVERLRITGSRYHLPSQLREEAPSVAPGQVPDFNELQADLTRMQSTPDVQVTPLVTAADEPGKLNIELKVQDSLPLHGSVELNNKQSFNTERGRLEAGMRYDNLFQRGHSIGANWIYSPRRPEQANTWVFNYAVPVRSAVEGRGDDRLSWLLVHSDSNTPTSLGGGTVVKGDTAGLRYRMPLASLSDGASNAWTIGLDYKRTRDSNQDVAGFSSDNPTLSYPVLSLGYDFQLARADGTQASGEATLALGTRWSGGRTVDCHGTPRDQFDCKRVGASPAFNALRLSGSYRTPLIGRWTASVKLQSQLTSQALVSGEQFGAGGADSVRGYYDFEQVGDLGLTSQLELISPPWPLLSGLNVAGLLFLDRGWLRVVDALPSEQAHIRMGSYGAGVRVLAGNGLQVRVDYAVPQFDTLKADSTGTLVPASGRNTSSSRRWELSARYVF